MCSKTGQSADFGLNNSVPLITFLSNGTCHDDGLGQMESLHEMMDIDSSIPKDGGCRTTHRISLIVPSSTDQTMISPSKRFEKVSVKELKEALPSQSSVLDKVMLVQSRCAEVNSGLCDGELRVEDTEMAPIQGVRNEADKRNTLESSRLEKISLLERLLGCIQPLTRWWNKGDTQDEKNSGKLDQFQNLIVFILERPNISQL